jgi:hypothetical protein
MRGRTLARRIVVSCLCLFQRNKSRMKRLGKYWRLRQRLASLIEDLVQSVWLVVVFQELELSS